MQEPPPLPVESVDFHLWQPCNMRCAFCFARFEDVRATVLPKGHLGPDKATLVVQVLAEAGFRKITFAGGEPFLCSWLPDLIRTAKISGMVTSVVTNGSLLCGRDLDELSKYLDWIVLSIDSTDQGTLTALGRMTRKRALTASEYLQICSNIMASGIRLKINTVVTQKNLTEDMSSFILAACPQRWKIMQVLPIIGQNDGSVESLLIDSAQFETFVGRHRRVADAGIVIVPERNDDMIGSYAMVDPAGRFFDNVAGCYTYSAPILTSGVQTAIAQVAIDRRKFLARGGRYDWVS